MAKQAWLDDRSLSEGEWQFPSEEIKDVPGLMRGCRPWEDAPSTSNTSAKPRYQVIVSQGSTCSRRTVDIWLGQQRKGGDRAQRRERLCGPAGCACVGRGTRAACELLVMLQEPQQGSAEQRAAVAVPHGPDGDGGERLVCRERRAAVRQPVEQSGLRGRSGRRARLRWMPCVPGNPAQPPGCPAGRGQHRTGSSGSPPQPGTSPSREASGPLFLASPSPGERARRQSQKRRLALTRYFWSLDYSIPIIIVCET